MRKRLPGLLLAFIMIMTSCGTQSVSFSSEPISTVPQNAASESETTETTKAPETVPADLSEPVPFDNRTLDSKIVFLEAEEKLPAGKQENNAGCVESYGKPGQPPGGDGQPERRGERLVKGQESN